MTAELQEHEFTDPFVTSFSEEDDEELGLEESSLDEDDEDEDEEEEE